MIPIYSSLPLFRTEGSQSKQIDLCGHACVYVCTLQKHCVRVWHYAVNTGGTWSKMFSSSVRKFSEGKERIMQMKPRVLSSWKWKEIKQVSRGVKYVFLPDKLSSNISTRERIQAEVSMRAVSVRACIHRLWLLLAVNFHFCIKSSAKF